MHLSDIRYAGRMYPVMVFRRDVRIRNSVKSAFIRLGARIEKNSARVSSYDRATRSRLGNPNTVEMPGMLQRI